MSDYPILELDFTGATPATGGSLAILETDFYSGPIADVKHYAGSNPGEGRLLVYFDVPAGRVRESFQLPAGMGFLLALMVSTGAVKESPNKKVKVDFSKLVGKQAYFHYTAPLPPSGSDEKTYPKYRFFTKGDWDRERARVPNHPRARVAPTATQAPVAAPVAAQAAPAQAAAVPAQAAAVAPSADGGDDFDFMS